MARLYLPHPYGAATRRAGRNHARRVMKRVDGAGSRREPRQPSPPGLDHESWPSDSDRDSSHRIQLDRESPRRPSLRCPTEEVDAVLELGRPLLNAGHDPGAIGIMLGDRERERAHANVCSHKSGSAPLRLVAGRAGCDRGGNTRHPPARIGSRALTETTEQLVPTSAIVSSA